MCIKTPLKCFHRFEEDITHISIPDKFTFPFYYDPHPISLVAVKELQKLISKISWKHNFGLIPNKEGDIIGKMFGVLVVMSQTNELGYLAAYSGKVADGNVYKQFVPSIFESLHDENGFYKIGEKELNLINSKIIELENNPDYLKALTKHDELLKMQESELARLKSKNKKEKKKRKEIRISQRNVLNDNEYNILIERLSKQSIRQNYELKDLTKYWNKKVNESSSVLKKYSKAIEDLKNERKNKSSTLQRKLFDQYSFINKEKEEKSLWEIFKGTVLKHPPSGAGECAAPKLLQYAFQHELKPIAIAEFWWGQSPNSEIRRHKYFYPACKGKCEPILNHMLEGIAMNSNPLVKDLGNQDIEIIYEDDYIVVINKPPEMLSVPGNTGKQSVLQKLRELYPKAEGPLLVHRLDMSTSGLLLAAKNSQAHKNLQLQFIKRYIKKRYVALLEGHILTNEGTIDLPLRGDLMDRPRQMVCFKEGKKAMTKWKVLESDSEYTRVALYPVTGRTHQLRVHTAHSKGLNSPIKGDDLYGQKADRLYLHAEYIRFQHPKTKQNMQFTIKPDF